jgi:hypothetical protein
MPTKASSSTVHPCNTALCPAKHRLEYICYQNISETDTTRISFDNGLVADCFSNMSQIANIIVEQEYLLIALPSDKSIYHGNCTRASPRCCEEVQLPKLVFEIMGCVGTKHGTLISVGMFISSKKVILYIASRVLTPKTRGYLWNLVLCPEKDVADLPKFGCIYTLNHV